jgi:hypothetical protein
MKKVLSKGDITVSRTFIDGYGQGMVTIRDQETATYITIYPEEASFLSDALKEVLRPVSSNPPPDQL